MIFEYIDSIFCDNIEDICELSVKDIDELLCKQSNLLTNDNILYYFKNINEYKFLCQNGIYKKNIVEWDIFNIVKKELFYIKTPIVKILNINDSNITFEICNPYDNYQVKIFEKIINYLHYIICIKNNTIQSISKYHIEPLIHRSYEKKIITIKITNNFTNCYDRYNNRIDYKIDENYLNYNDEYILCLALQKKWINKNNNYMGCEWNIAEIQSIKFDYKNDIKFINNNNSYNTLSKISSPPIPPPLPPIFNCKQHKIVIQKDLVLNKIKKDLPIEKMIAPSLNEIQSILNKMKKNKS